MRQTASYGLTGARHRGQIMCMVGLRLVRLLVKSTAAANTMLKPAPIPINRIGISRSHRPDCDVVVAVAVVRVEVVRVPVSPVVVVLLVDVVTNTVVVWDVWVVVTSCPETGAGPLPAIIGSAKIVKVNRMSELALERAVFARTDTEAPWTLVRHGRGDMTFSVTGKSSGIENALSGSVDGSSYVSYVAR